MRQLTVLIRLFDKITARVDAESLGAIIEMVADAQRAKLADGGDANALPYADLSTTQIISKAKERVHVVSTLMSVLLDEMPEIVAEFSDMTVAEYNELGIDEGVPVLLAIFTVNYAFFTQSLPRTLAGYMQTWASKNPEKSEAVRAVIKRTNSRR